MDAQQAIRRAHPDLPLLDVRFEDVVGDLPRWWNGSTPTPA